MRSGYGSVLCPLVACAAAVTSAAGQVPASADATSKASFPGISYVHPVDNAMLRTKPGPNARVLCFDLKSTGSSQQPLILQPDPALSAKAGAPCWWFDLNEPLRAKQQIVVAIDASGLTASDLANIAAININVTTAQGSPLNPATVRTSFPAPGGGGKFGILPVASQLYLLGWPSALVGDAIPTVSVSALYNPSGDAAKSQVVSLLSLDLPQVHSLARYNLVAGVVFSGVRNPAFAVPGGLTGTNTTDAQVRTSNNPTVDPVLLLTVYPGTVDAEKDCPFPCFVHEWFGVTGGLSLASPSSSFYLGVSTELVRNMQLFLGANWAKVDALPKPAVAISNTATTAITAQHFASGFAVGLTFNVAGFVQSLFGGGGGGGAGKGAPAAGSS